MITIGVVLVVILGGYFGYQAYMKAQAKKALASKPILPGAAVRPAIYDNSIDLSQNPT